MGESEGQRELESWRQREMEGDGEREGGKGGREGVRVIDREKERQRAN